MSSLQTLVQAGQTTTGVAFASLAPQPGGPAPTLLLFAMSAVDTLAGEPYGRVGRLLHASGWNVVSLDLPCHGTDRRAGEPPELAGWAARIRNGEDIAAAFQARVNDVVHHIVAIRMADPARLAAAGTSRGGFMAFQAALGHPGIGAVAAFSPVTDLGALSEFSGQAETPLVQRLSLLRSAEKLADRAAWIVIGHADDRVDTRKVAAFAEALKTGRATPAPAGRLHFRLIAVPGHASFPAWHDEAAQWLLQTQG